MRTGRIQVESFLRTPSDAERSLLQRFVPELTIRTRRNWKDYTPEYNNAFRTALLLQAILAVLTALVLDSGRTHRAFWVSVVCHWAAVWIILFRRPVNPTRIGDPGAVSRRLALLSGVSLLIPDAWVEEIADEIIARSLMPSKARLDALHVASAAVARVEYLLTQNCRHIANAHVLPRVYDFLADLGLPRLLICTPAEFLGDPSDVP